MGVSPTELLSRRAQGRALQVLAVDCIGPLQRELILCKGCGGAFAFFFKLVVLLTKPVFRPTSLGGASVLYICGAVYMW